MPIESFVLQPRAGRPIDLGGFLMTVKATADDTDGAFTLLSGYSVRYLNLPDDVKSLLWQIYDKGNLRSFRTRQPTRISRATYHGPSLHMWSTDRSPTPVLTHPRSFLTNAG